MVTFWFIAVAFMITMYVLLDGFDLGAGAIHLVAAKDDRERRMILKAIGPVWDGNEVWLIAAGGSLFFAFPLLYASGFSGFYLPLIIVLWLLMIRGLSVELRKHIDDPMWAAFWDFMFFLGSSLLAIFFGAALGNVVRGVPLTGDGNFFFQPLWTNFSPFAREPGILDWYTVLIAVLALVTLITHGANWISLKTEHDLNARSRKISRAFALATAALTALVTPLTFWVSPWMFDNFLQAPVRFRPAAHRYRRSRRHGHIFLHRTRPCGLPFLRRLHPRDADQHRLRRLPEGAAGGELREQHHHFQRRLLTVQPDRRAGVVEHRDGPRRRLLYRHLPPLPRQGEPGRRRVLELSAISGWQSAFWASSLRGASDE